MPSKKMDKEKDVDVLFARYQKTRDVATRNQIVEEYLFLVDMLVKKYLNKGVDYDDLYQVGSMALVLAVERFDASKGYAFSSFATPTIIGEIKRYFRDKGWAMKVPRYLQEIALNLPAAKEELYDRLKRPPTIPELSKYMDHSEDDILKAMDSGLNYNTYSLNQVSEDSDGGGENNLFEGYARIDEEGYEQFENAEILKKVVDGLTENERQVFWGRLVNKKTQHELAKSLNVSQMTVSRMEHSIREKVKAEYYQ
jgi:RNA polymerase sigma-B factor